MGQFDAGEQALQEVSNLGWVVQQIRRYCAAKDTRVHKLERGIPGRSRR